MIKFEFVLSDIDAGNLIDILNEEQVRARAKATDFLSQSQGSASRVVQANANWYNAHADYLEALKQKVLAGNTRVD